MRKFLALPTCSFSVISMLVFTSASMFAGVRYTNAEEITAAFDTLEANTSSVDAPVAEELEWSEEMPVLTPERKTEMEYWADHTHLPGPVLKEEFQAPAAGAESESESVQHRKRSLAPLAPGSPTLFRNVNFASTIPAGFKSNVMECSTSNNGKYAFYTGNWFAARSINGGSTWAYVDPFSGFSDFCCDQVTIYDESHNRLYWLRMGVPGANPLTGNYENVFKLGVSSDGGASFCTYTFSPTNVNAAWTNQWFDYPHIQLGADNLYITWNMFNSSGSWVRTLIQRLPLDNMASCAGFSYSYYTNTSWFTFVPVQGARHTMYWASNWPTTAPQNSRIAIWRWDEDSGTISSFVRNVTAWTATFRGDALCGSASGNWAARYDQRVLTGARYSIMGTNVKIRGRKVLGWWWNVQEGGSFPFPYIESAAFFEDTLSQVAGNQGRPLVWNSTTCFAYPSCTPNKRQDLGLIFHYSTGTARNPSIAYAIGDDFAVAPAPWTYFNVRTSNARPTDNKWGDYNTVREFEPSEKFWIGGAHYLPTTGVGGCCSASAPVYFVFGRERDMNSWLRWRGL